MDYIAKPPEYITNQEIGKIIDLQKQDGVKSKLIQQFSGGGFININPTTYIQKNIATFWSFDFILQGLIELSYNYRKINGRLKDLKLKAEIDKDNLNYVLTVYDLNTGQLIAKSGMKRFSAASLKLNYIDEIQCRYVGFEKSVIFLITKNITKWRFVKI